ncbi:MAG: DUF305 domain-containing protein [Microbacterium sp.]
MTMPGGQRIEPDDREADASPERAAESSGSARRRRWALIALAIVLVAGAAFAIGRFTTFGAVTGPNDADVGFARDMQVHHSQAVEMALIEYAATTDEELRFTAYDIATGQAAQGGEMYGWLVEWGAPQYGTDPLMAWMQGTEHDHGGAVTPTATDAELRDAMGMATDDQLAELRAKAGTTAGDCLFVDLMVTHHAGALEMVEAVRGLGSDPRVHQVAGAMGETQQREIDAMNAIADRIGCE